MLKIRLQRTGRRNDPSYRVIVAEHTMAAKGGNFLERLGHYNPRTKERQLDADRIKHWLSQGAQASGTMHNMLVSEGIVSGSKINVLPKKTPPAGGPGEEVATDAAAAVAVPTAEAGGATEEAAPAAEAVAEEKQEAPAEPAAETPAEEEKPADAESADAAPEEEKPAA